MAMFVLCLIVMIFQYLAFLKLEASPSLGVSCTENRNYTTNNTYSGDLNALFNSLSISDYGFSSSTIGRDQDRTFVQALCRADQSPNQCQECIRAASDELVSVCLNEIEGFIVYEHCMVQYSNDGFNTTDSYDKKLVAESNDKHASDGNEYFREDLTRLLADLRVKAASGNNAIKAGVGTRSTSEAESPMIYAMVQCMPILSSEECRICLANVTIVLASFYDMVTGMKIFTPRCMIRYELHSFYNETRLHELGLLSPLLPPSPTPTRRSDDYDVRTKNTREKHDDTLKIIVVIVTISVFLTLAATCSLIIFLRKRMNRPSSHETIETIDDEMSSVESVQFDFGEIRAATCNFDIANKLGEGGFGDVYKGQLSNGQEIAVKRLSNHSRQGDKEFKNEVLLLAKLQHRNLVRLLGFSVEGTEKLLIYELVHNASLDKFIFDPLKRVNLDWNTRQKIIGGIVRALMYLHEDSRLRIIHRDLKASNVLLDMDMSPQIADFGTARSLVHDEIEGNTSIVVGTLGYFAPEYRAEGNFSVKSDVYSFGVLLLEIVSGQKNAWGTPNNLITLAKRAWQRGVIADIIDPLLKNSSNSISDMLKCLHIGLLCVQSVEHRPTMTVVHHMLNTSASTFPQPIVPTRDMVNPPIPEAALPPGIDSWIVAIRGGSRNEMSVTELYPR